MDLDHLDGTISVYEARIDLLVGKYCSKRPYRCTIEDKKEIENQVAKLLENKLIEESYSPFAAPVTLAFKRDENKRSRLCIDFRELNKIVIPQAQPFPLIEDLIIKTRNYIKKLCSQPVLEIFDKNLPIRIYTDASLEGIGGIFKQIQNNECEVEMDTMSGKRGIENRRNMEDKKEIGKTGEAAIKRGRPGKAETLWKKPEKGTQDVGSMFRETSYGEEKDKRKQEEKNGSTEREENQSEIKARQEESKDGEGKLIGDLVKALGEEQEGECNVLIAGDLNARIGREGGNVGWEGEIVERRSKDEVINEYGKKLLEIVRENGWQFLNGNKTGGEEGEYTHIGGRGATVIDYVVTNTGAWDRIKEMRVGERTESDHMPLVVELWQEEEEIKKKEKGKKRVFTVWDNEAKDMYRKRLEEAEMKESEVKKIWEKLKKLIDNSMVKKEIYLGKRKEEAAWFDEECERSKRQVGRIYKKFRSGKKDREEYIAERRRHREEYFMNLLGGKEQRETERRIRKRREEDDERDLTTAEIEEQIQKLKEKKATGEDQIPSEAWKYCTSKVKGKVIEMVQKVVQKERGKRGGKIYAFFMDLRAAFDTVNRAKLWQVMERRGVGRGLIERVKELYEEVKAEVYTEEGNSEEFWLTEGVRQGCPLSLTLFALYISDMEERLKEIAKSEKALKEMLKILRRYLREKQLTLSTEKSKVIVFEEGTGRKKNRRYGENKEQVNKLAKKAMMAVRQVWGLGERLFRDNFGIRMWLYEKLVESVMIYGVEAWGLDRWTPNYIVRKETLRNKFKIKTIERAIRFEEKVEESEGKPLLRKCLEEKIKSQMVTEWGKQRIRSLNESGYSQEGIEELKRRGEKMSEKVKEREIEVDRQTLHGKIQRAKYNERYKEIEPHTQLPEYLRKEGKNMEMKRKARARCGNLEESNRYWEKEENRKCRLCKEGLGTIRHLIRECKQLKRTALKEQDIVAEESKEEVMEWCREWEKKRKELQITDIG
ncbi:PREDICTED: uncharacterized protein LOC107192490 [Dufourea novaeangliae]|uniref:uncharacterized protein LOC107192490 n=1 Tax=Dufourea novaeangliae TaxID=178035 RepID=UPI000767B46A|nr:PREDICTED: uncharacterized protein LOC107192490 [Dufourea novaeangliae]